MNGVVLLVGGLLLVAVIKLIKRIHNMSIVDTISAQ